MKKFEEVVEFLKIAKLDRVAFFRYSREEDTIAGKMDNQIDEDIKISRINRLIETQNKIYHQINKELEGKVFRALVEGIDPDSEKIFVRTSREAPEVDGTVIIETDDDSIQPGDMVDIKIIGTEDFVNYGVLV